MLHTISILLLGSGLALLTLARKLLSVGGICFREGL